MKGKLMKSLYSKLTLAISTILAMLSSNQAIASRKPIGEKNNKKKIEPSQEDVSNYEKRLAISGKIQTSFSHSNEYSVLDGLIIRLTSDGFNTVEFEPMVFGGPSRLDSNIVDHFILELNEISASIRPTFAPEESFFRYQNGSFSPVLLQTLIKVASREDTITVSTPTTI